MDEKDLKQSKKSTTKNDIVLNDDDDVWESESSPDEDEDEDDESEDDEEVDEDEDDEEDIFKNDSEDIEDEDGINLLTTVSKLQSSLKKPEKERRKLVSEATDENEFNLPTNGNKLSLNDMLAAVDSSISKDAILIDDDSKALSAPLPKRIQQRHDRAVAYEITKEEISKWEDTVQQNRQAEVLKFPLNPTVKHNDAATTFKSDNVPTTELEKKINDVLKESALIDERKEATFEEIAVAKLSLEDMQKRTNELRLMRELMFRDEKRARRIKKIKSKQFHKIKKKERLRAQELVEGSDLESDGEDHDMKRAQERMSLKHKTQSNWAKTMIKSGMSKDASSRAELEEMLRQGEKLRSKQLGHEEGDQSDDDVSDIEKEYNNDINNDSIKSKLGKGVLAMDFMKNAEERNKQENLKQLEELRKLEMDGDLQAFEENSGIVNITKNQGRRVYTPSSSGMKDDITQLNEELREEIEDDESKNLTNKLSKKFNIISSTVTSTTTNSTTTKDTIKSVQSEVDQGEEINPWLTENSEPIKKSHKITTVDQDSSKLSKAAAKIAKKASKKHGKKTGDDELIDIDETLKVLTTHQGQDSENEEEGEGISQDDSKMFKQKELIKEAFAGDDVVQEFEIEKKRVARDEDDKHEDVTLPGWGDWAGGSKKNKKRKVILKKIDGVVQQDKRKDKHLKNVIINEKVNKKNLKYQSSEVPFPFESREQYERSLRMPVGQEWTSRETHQKLTMPRIITKQGTVIDPLKAPF
ncbi:small-subunit processome, partial [Scheffersomyces coipomensis]|uniref:small-subunit processome n=1 Tax=Scheffersomyces coipomensis TaxID=1788519 RepID=UPI00315D38A3